MYEMCSLFIVNKIYNIYHATKRILYLSTLSFMAIIVFLEYALKLYPRTVRSSYSSMVIWTRQHFVDTQKACKESEKV